MNYFEKIFALLAILFSVALLLSLFCFAELRLPARLFPLALAGITVNAGLLFVILKDLFSRSFEDSNHRYFWLVALLLFWPSILYYMFRHGFRPRV